MNVPEARTLALAAACTLICSLLYGGSALLGDHFVQHYQLYFSWEKDIPLVPQAAFVYLSGSLCYLPVILLLPKARQIWPVVVTVVAEFLVASLCFMLLPLEDGYPPAPPLSGLSGNAWRLAGLMALRHNYLPSLHVALANTAALIIGRVQGRPNWAMMIWAAAIGLSTLLTHQHHLADVLAGSLLAWAAVKWIYAPLAATQEPG